MQSKSAPGAAATCSQTADESAAPDAVRKTLEAQSTHFKLNRRYALIYDELTEARLLKSEPSAAELATISNYAQPQTLSPTSFQSFPPIPVQRPLAASSPIRRVLRLKPADASAESPEVIVLTLLLAFSKSEIFIRPVRCAVSFHQHHCRLTAVRSQRR
jgi:hypothetical protein